MNAINETRVINAAGGVLESHEAWPRVLVVDDELQQAKVAAWFIVEMYPTAEVHIARDGEEALEEAHGLRPHLVMTDIRMPGLTGIEVCRLIKQDPYLSRIKVIAMTGFNDPLTQQEALHFGVDAYLTKPIDPQAWRRDLARLLGRGPSPGPKDDWSWEG